MGLEAASAHRAGRLFCGRSSKSQVFMSSEPARAQRVRMVAVVDFPGAPALAVPIYTRPKRRFAGDVPVSLAGWSDMVARCRSAHAVGEDPGAMQMRLSDDDAAACQRAVRQVVETTRVEVKYKPSPIFAAAMPKRWQGRWVRPAGAV